jgi:hypothetical protein
MGCLGILIVLLALAPPEEGAAPPAVAEKPAAPGQLQAIVGGWVYPVSGPPILRGVVLFRDGKIVEVGSEIPVPAGAEVIHAEGKYVTPGFVAMEASRIGASGAPGRVEDGLDPYQREMRIALAAGITTAHVVESGFGGFFGFESPMPFGSTTALIKTTAGDLQGMLLKEPAAGYFSFQRSPLALFQMREGFERAAQHLRRVEEAEKARAKPPDTSPEIERYARILRNQVPTIVVVDSPDEIRAILEVRRAHPFDLVLSGAGGGWVLAPQLAAEKVPVLTKARGRDFNFDFSSPAVPEDGVIPIRAPAVFAQAGVRVAILPYRRGVSIDGIAGRDLTALPLEAAYAVRGGLDEEAALRAITLEPARILRVADRVGSLEKGKDADILILSRHPLDYRSYVETAIINGKVYYQRSKSPLFREIPLR